MTTQKNEIDRLLGEMSEHVMSYILEVESGFPERWVPATHLKEQLGLKRDSYPVGNEIQNRTGWLVRNSCSIAGGTGKGGISKEWEPLLLS